MSESESESGSGTECESGTETAGPALRPLPPPPEGLPRSWSFAVGPSQLHPAVPGAIRAALAEGLPSWSHRSDAFRREVAGAVEALSAVLGIPEGYRVLFLGSATEAMERVAQGLLGGEGMVLPGAGHGPGAARSFHLVHGAFARRFRTVARNLGGDPAGVEVEDGQGFDLGEIRVPGGYGLLAVTQNETSTGVALDPGGIAALARRHPEIPTVVDTVTAAPTLPLELGAVDGAFFSVQKLFGLPAGLGVLVVSPRLVERVRERRGGGAPAGGYMHIPALAEAASRHETGPTPNMLGIRLLKVVARALLERGLDRVRRDAEANAVRIHDAAVRAGWIPFPTRVEDRSTTVLVYRVPGEGGAGRARDRLQGEGFQVSAGYGSLKEAVVRLANFPAHPPEAVEALAHRIETLDLA